jgi:hypothetical protein
MRSWSSVGSARSFETDGVGSDMVYDCRKKNELTNASCLKGTNRPVKCNKIWFQYRGLVLLHRCNRLVRGLKKVMNEVIRMPCSIDVIKRRRGDVRKWRTSMRSRYIPLSAV